MYATTQLLHDKLREKKGQLITAKEKEESLVDSLCSQRQARKDLERSINELESDIKTIVGISENQKISARPMGQDYGSSALSPGCMTGTGSGIGANISGSQLRGEG